MSEVQVNPQIVINDLQAKLSDAEMRETFAKAQVQTLLGQVEEAQRIIADLNQQVRDAEGQVVEVE